MRVPSKGPHLGSERASGQRWSDVAPLVVGCLLLSSCGGLADQVIGSTPEQEGADIEVAGFEDERPNDDAEGGDGGLVEIDQEIDQETDEEIVTVAAQPGTDEQATAEFESVLVEGWPESVSLPEGTRVLESAAVDVGVQREFSATFRAPLDEFDHFEEHFRGLDLPIRTETVSDNSGARALILVWGNEGVDMGNLVLTESNGDLMGRLTAQVSN